MKKTITLLLTATLSATIFAQKPINIGKASYAEYTPLSICRTDAHGGDLSYQTDNRHLYITDDMKGRPVPTNDWWTYALMNRWTGNLWVYPVMVSANANGVEISLPDYWSSDGCEMHWTTTLKISADAFTPQEALIADWSDFHIAILLQDSKDPAKQIRITLMQGSPLVWIEANGISAKVNNPDANKYAVFETSISGKQYISVGVLTNGVTKQTLEPYAFRIPQKTTVTYRYDRNQSKLTTTFHIDVNDLSGKNNTTILTGFLPHHYKQTTLGFTLQNTEYQTPRGKLRLAAGNDFKITYDVNGMLPFFPAPADNLSGYDRNKILQLTKEYAAGGSFGGDTYWGGKGLEQMMHYMTFAYQLGDMETFELAKSRLKAALINWFTYTPGEREFFFARYKRFGAMVGYATSYDSDTFNDHHFHYGYYTYAAAVLCLFDDDFRLNYGEMAREVALDYAGWIREDSFQQGENRYPWFRMLNPWLGHSMAGGMGNEGNGNGQESTSEAMQSWGGLFMLGMALGDEEMIDAGAFGYTLERRATAEYWFDRDHENINHSLYKHPYCCNLTMQGVGWWTWFSGDPVWMHSIQWLPISPVLTNYLGEDLNFARWDYTEMYSKKEVGNYEAATKGLGDESGLGNVCLSYLSLFNPDSAAHVFDRAWTAGKPLARNTDTGGITYWLIHSHRTLGDRNYSLRANYPLATAYTKNGNTTYVVYNATDSELSVRYSDGKTWKAPAHQMSIFTSTPKLTYIIIEAEDVIEPSSTNQINIRFLDQYGASVRSDSTLLYTAPSTRGTATISLTYQGVKGVKEVKIDAKPSIQSAKIVPEVNYTQVGRNITFSLSATDQYGNTYPSSWQQDFSASQPGKYTVSCTENSKTFSHSFVVLPNFKNLALGKPVTESSHENDGTKKENATDGDTNTRWGSAHKDGEWIMVDLGHDCFIDNISILWEAAYASKYTIEVSSDQSSWTLFNEIGAANAAVSTPIGINGRYVRLTGKERGTAYGISLYEFQVFGVDLATSSRQLYALAILPDKDVLNESDQTNIAVKGFNILGEEMSVQAQLSVVSGNATIKGNTITCNEAGEVVVHATTNGISAEKTLLVQETVKITKITVSPDTVNLVVGQKQILTFTTLTQFGDARSIRQLLFTATEKGEFDVEGEIDGWKTSAHIIVGDFDGLNLALGKPTTISSSENENAMGGDKAVDGDMETRWSSSFNDGEWIVIDLEHQYHITEIRLFWEASYATSFNLQLSTDGISYNEVYSTTTNTGTPKGQYQTIGINEQIARYVRLNCLKRVNQYGNSLYEIQVFGNGIEPEPDPELNNWDYTSLVNISELNLSMPAYIYSITGQLCKICTLRDLPTLGLQTGIYLIRQDNKITKIVLN